MEQSTKDAISTSTALEKNDLNTTILSVSSSASESPSKEKSDLEITTETLPPPNFVPVPWTYRLLAVILVSGIGFGSHWSSGIIGAMKSTIKKQLDINNTQYSLLEASEDFMATALIMFSGLVTDRIGGAKAILYGNAIYTIGSILVAAATTMRNYRFMVFGRVILALGDIATQIAQYKIFSSWFPPSAGFASTLGLELGIGKIGAFVGKSTANIISSKTGDFSWVFWISAFMNIFTNFMTILFYLFTKHTAGRFFTLPDPATGEKLAESNKKFEIRKVLELPWAFWAIMGFSMFETSTAVVFTQNATEFAEQRFGIDSITVGWYTAVLQYAGFFVVPVLGVFVDIFGNRISLLNWAPTIKGTTASFGIYAFAYSFGPTVIIDSIRTSMRHQSVFGSAYAAKITMNNAMNIIVRVMTGVIQDRDNNSYAHVTIVYVFLSACSLLVSIVLLYLSYTTIDLGRLQWTWKQRLSKGDLINEAREIAEGDKIAGDIKGKGRRNRQISKAFLIALGFLTLGSWVAYFGGWRQGIIVKYY